VTAKQNEFQVAALKETMKEQTDENL